MIVITRIVTRPSGSIPFFTPPTDFVSKQQDFIAQNKLTVQFDQKNKSDPSIFTITYTLSFVDQTSFDAYDTDPVVVAYRTAELTYNNANGITSERIVTTA